VLVVQVGGSEDLDCVDLGVVEHASEVGVDLRSTPQRAAADLAQSFVHVADGHYVAVRVLEIARDIHVGDVPVHLRPRGARARAFRSSELSFGKLPIQLSTSARAQANHRRG
jgi:hypothetical protein